MLLSNFGGNLGHNGLLAGNLLLAELGQVVSRVVAGADDLGLRREIVRALDTEDAVLRVLHRLVMNNGVLEVEVSLGDVLVDDGSSDTGEISEGSLLGPVADEGSLSVRRVLVE